MTVDLDEKQDDSFLPGFSGMRTYDVSQRRSRQLRRRCHDTLRAEPPPTRLAWMIDGALFRRFIGPALGGAWCLAYLLEIMRRAAAVYYGTQ
jgi:hypothetical protein